MQHKTKPKGSLLAALDIGSSKIGCFIGRVVDDQGHFEVLGVGHQGSRGIKSGVITDLSEAEAAISNTVHAAEKMASEVIGGYPLREVIVNVPGAYCKSHLNDVDVKIAGHEVVDNDVKRALVKAQDKIVGIDDELIHTIPVNFKIDNHEGIREPRGMHGENMHVGIHLVSGDVNGLQNIASCVERSHLEISAFCLSSYAAGLATLVEDEMDLGCTVIDMGGGVTSIAVFHGGKLIFSDAISVGGQHVTSDIATGLTTSMADAERIKNLYGNAMASGTDDSDMIDVPRLGEEAYLDPNHIPRSMLIGIMQPRLEEIFEMVRSRIEQAGLGSALGRRVVLTGGASQISGMRDLAQHILDKQVRVGRPIHVGSLPDSVSGPAFATTAGLLTYISEREDEMPAQIIKNVEPESLVARVSAWFKENW